MHYAHQTIICLDFAFIVQLPCVVSNLALIDLSPSSLTVHLDLNCTLNLWKLLMLFIWHFGVQHENHFVYKGNIVKELEKENLVNPDRTVLLFPRNIHR